MANVIIPQLLYFYRIVKIKKIYDGDTIKALIDVGLDTLREEKIRFQKLDTPESKKTRKKLRQDNELIMGKDVLKFAKILLTSYSDNLYVYTIKDKRGKYGRYLGELQGYNKKARKQICINQEIFKYCLEKQNINILPETDKKKGIKVYTPEFKLIENSNLLNMDSI